MKKVVAHILKLKTQLLYTKNQTKEGSTNKQHGVHCINRCRIELLQEASDSIIKLVQAKHFKDELGKLKQKERSLSKASALCSLDPFVDGKGIILELAGRLEGQD